MTRDLQIMHKKKLIMEIKLQLNMPIAQIKIQIGPDEADRYANKNMICQLEM